AQAITQHFRARGWIVVIAHFRGCSGFPNRMARWYFSGDSDDIQFILATLQQRLPSAKWHAAGVSLCGYAMRKNIGEQGSALSWLAASVAASVPLDLVA